MTKWRTPGDVVDIGQQLRRLRCGVSTQQHHTVGQRFGAAGLRSEQIAVHGGSSCACLRATTAGQRGSASMLAARKAEKVVMVITCCGWG
jgi:hypothetical protein